jgi:hypothetical protein
LSALEAPSLVAVGVEFELLFRGAIAVEIAHHLALGAQHRGVVAVLPARVFGGEGKLAVEVLGTRVAACQGEAKLAGTGPVVGLGGVGRGGEQRRSQDRSVLCSLRTPEGNRRRAGRENGRVW